MRRGEHLDDLVKRCADAFFDDDQAEALRLAQEAQRVARTLISWRAGSIPEPPDPTTATVRDALVVALDALAVGTSAELVAADLRHRLELVAA